MGVLHLSDVLVIAAVELQKDLVLLVDGDTLAEEPLQTQLSLIVAEEAQQQLQHYRGPAGTQFLPHSTRT